MVQFLCYNCRDIKDTQSNSSQHLAQVISLSLLQKMFLLVFDQRRHYILLYVTLPFKPVGAPMLVFDIKHVNKLWKLILSAVSQYLDF